MLSAKRLAVVVATLTTGLIMAGAGTANAASVNGPLGTTVQTCPKGYTGVITGSDATGNVWVCENVF